ncbi:MAG: RnfABCDGE type electron transport complex subunit D [bacterium]|nr:RnfABCDGE type electron transport complex subunit D [bacterium]
MSDEKDPKTSPTPPEGDKAVEAKPAPKKEKPAAPPKLVMSASPHVHKGQDVTGIMRDVFWALVPAVLVGIWFFGLPALRVVAITVGGCLLFEWGYLKLLKRPGSITDFSAAVTGLLLAMNLPSTSPWWMCLVGAFVAIIIAKQIYGGLGYNPFNPALVARVLLLISFPVQMTTWAKPSSIIAFDAATGATPLGALKEYLSMGNTLPLPADQGASILQLVIGLRGGCLGEVSVAALLLGGIFLLWRGHIRWQIPVGFIGTVALVTGIAWLASPGSYASPLLHCLSGGLILGAFFMATDMVTTPVTRKGMLVFGIGCGLITAVIRLWGGYPEGVSFAILLMNAATPLIDRFTKPRVFGARKLYQEAKTA